MNAAPERLLDLLADEAVFGLADDERTELERLLDTHENVGRDDYALAAAALDLALTGHQFEAAPDHVLARTEAALRATLIAPAAVPVAQTPAAPPTSTRVSSLAIWRPLAAAALVMSVLWLGWTSLATPSPAARRDALLSRSSDVLTVAWAPGGDETASAASGDVVWSDGWQEGYMRFAGLAPNDPDRFQYQLWIFDDARDAAFPVDGGVFDVRSDRDEVIVPITARLDVSRATLFAVTVEKPGGVVVSDRSRMALLAAVD